MSIKSGYIDKGSYSKHFDQIKKKLFLGFIECSETPQSFIITFSYF